MTQYDTLIIGGGPAGMMAAISAAEAGKKVVLLEKNAHLGKKLLITGGGRCNVTNSEFDLRKFLAHYKESDKFLFSAFSQYNVKDTLEFFHMHDMPTKVENEGRTFPVSDSARSVYNVLVKEMEKQKVTVLTEVQVLGFDIIDGSDGFAKHIDGIRVKVKGKEEVLHAKTYVLATGGTSHPETGSTGDAYPWLREMGHSVIIPKPVLVPVTIKDKWVKDLQGVSFSNIKITLYAEGEKIAAKKGRVLCTHFGITGPTILNMSKKISDLLDLKKKVTLNLDLLPEFDHGTLNEKLQNVFGENKAKMIKNTLGEIIPNAVVVTVLEMSKIDGDTVCSQVTREERMVLIGVLKGMVMQVNGLLGEDKAIIASGGVPLKEIDFKTCSSRVCDNLRVIGDLLDIDRPSGGYSLQLCWTTGYVAGK
ncbi:MAG: NAD(P)/FAD-dependent oxidoreductase [Patescibacteria group bacterium]